MHAWRGRCLLALVPPAHGLLADTSHRPGHLLVFMAGNAPLRARRTCTRCSHATPLPQPHAQLPASCCVACCAAATSAGSSCSVTLSQPPSAATMRAACEPSATANETAIAGTSVYGH